MTAHYKLQVPKINDQHATDQWAEIKDQSSKTSSSPSRLERIRPREEGRREGARAREKTEEGRDRSGRPNVE